MGSSSGRSWQQVSLGGRRGELLPRAQQQDLESIKNQLIKFTFTGVALVEPCSTAVGYSTPGWRSWAIDLLLVSPFPKEGGGFLALQLALGSHNAPDRWVTLCAHPQVAIKSIRKDKIKDEQDLVHIRREIEIMSSLNHPHIIAVHEGEPSSPFSFPAASLSGAGYRGRLRSSGVRTHGSTASGLGLMAPQQRG